MSAIRATYGFRAIFILPKKLRLDDGATLEDLDNHDLLKDWGIKWNILTLYYKDGTEEEIEASNEVTESHDLKRPDDLELLGEDDCEVEELLEEKESEEEAETEQEDSDDDYDASVIFDCNHCGKSIIKNSEDHDNCVTFDDGKKWYCLDCYDYGENAKSSDEEEEDEDSKHDSETEFNLEIEDEDEDEDVIDVRKWICPTNNELYLKSAEGILYNIYTQDQVGNWNESSKTLTLL
jgi:hypothetical protein